MSNDTCTECGRTIPASSRNYTRGDRVLCYACAAQEADERGTASEVLAEEQSEQRITREMRR
ncbi:hypothetical protein [Methanocella sp. MCL-LM]|uniref:hypothetical protein n=1 Tax=Methanocella sp. MCL-LM TaxID=3412035 RepID=UPI003C776A8F